MRSLAVPNVDTINGAIRVTPEKARLVKKALL